MASGREGGTGTATKTPKAEPAARGRTLPLLATSTTVLLLPVPLRTTTAEGRRQEQAALEAGEGAACPGLLRRCHALADRLIRRAHGARARGVGALLRVHIGGRRLPLLGLGLLRARRWEHHGERRLERARAATELVELQRVEHQRLGVGAVDLRVPAVGEGRRAISGGQGRESSIMT